MSNQWSLVRTVDPTVEPITVSALKAHLRISLTTEDELLQNYIRAATAFAEIYQTRQLLPATYVLTLDYFPSWTLKLAMPPISAVNSITYLDTNGNTQTLAPSLYVTDLYSSPGRITPAYSQIWPVTRIQINGVQITYVAGYAAPQNVPYTTRQAIKLISAQMYEDRTQTESNRLPNINDIPLSLLDLLDCDRILDFSGVLGSSNNIPGAVTAWGGQGWWN